MFHTEEELRLTAVHGFLLLLHGTASHASEPGNSGAACGSTALQFQLELLGFIRRSFSQQASIRSERFQCRVGAKSTIHRTHTRILPQ